MQSPSKISIRPYELADIPSLFEAVTESKSHLAPWMPWCGSDYSLEDSRDWVEMQVKLFAAGEEYAFVILDENGLFAGGCGLNRLDHLNRRANLGYWLRASAVGRGAASEAVRLLAAWAFANTRLERLEIVVSVDNHASLRTAEKAGASREGIAGKRLLLEGRHHDCAVYALLRPSGAVSDVSR